MTLRKRSSLYALFYLLLSLHGAAISAPLPGRIVSLSPAMTETLYSLGLGGMIVGVTNVCDRPDEARNKPKVGGMANPSLEAIVALKPDLVVMTMEGNSKGLVERLGGLGIKTYVFTAARLAELLTSLGANRVLLQRLAVNARACATTDATETVAQLCLEATHA